MNSFLREPYRQFKKSPHPPSANFPTMKEMWPSKRRSKKSLREITDGRLLRRRLPLLPHLKKKQRGWGRRNKNKPKNPDDVSVIDAGWNGPVKLLDPRKNGAAPPKDSVMRFKTGWGGSAAAEPVPVFVRKGPFPFERLPTEIQLRIVECVLERKLGESWEIWDVSRKVRDLCVKVETGRNYKNNIMGF